MDLIIKGLSCICGAYGAAYLITGVMHPEFFLDVFAINDAERRWGKGWRVWLRMALAIIGLGLFFYAGAYAIFSVIPADWGNFDEEGAWEYTRGALQLTFSGYVTLLLVSSLEEKAEAAVCREILVCKLKAYRSAIRFYGNDNEKISAARDLHKLLTELSERARSNFLMAACAEELRSVEFILRDLDKPK